MLSARSSGGRAQGCSGGGRAGNARHGFLKVSYVSSSSLQADRDRAAMLQDFI